MACARCGFSVPRGHPRCPACGKLTDVQEPSAGAVLGGVFGLVGLAVIGLGFVLSAVEFTPGFPTTASLLDLTGGSPGYLWLALVPVLGSGVAALGFVFLFGHHSLPPTAVRLAVLIPMTLVAVNLVLLVAATFALGSATVLEYCAPFGGCQTRPYVLREGIPIAAGGAAWSLAGYLVGLVSIRRMPAEPAADAAA